MAGEHVRNVAAVLEGYNSGNLTWLDGQYYAFQDGRSVAGPRPMSEFDPQKVLFEEFPGPRSVWLEVVSSLDVMQAEQSFFTKKLTF